MIPFVEYHHEEIAALVSYLNRAIINESLHEIGYAESIARYLSAHEILSFEYTPEVEPLSDGLRRVNEKTLCLFVQDFAHE